MKVILLSNDRIGEQMAGPGIRYWELAKALSSSHQVTLVAPGLTWKNPSFTCVSRGSRPWKELMRGQDVAVAQLVTPPVLMALRRARVRLVLDAYDPMELETLETNKFDEPGLRRAREQSLNGVQNLALLTADAVICASERQRDLWLGALTALGRVTSASYDADSTLRNVVDVVPFGCPAEPPRRVGEGPRSRFGLGEEDTLVLWGGGIWEWFDPLSVIRALARLQDSHPQVKLIFMGVKHPSDGSTGSDKARRTEALVDELGLRDKSVFFNYGWVPYAERQDFLLDSDAGISAHLDHAETRFSFRTRVLDYFWAGLPCLTTEGDSMADLVSASGAGEVIGFGDDEAWASALARLHDDREARASAARASHALAEDYTWPSIARKLDRVMSTARCAPRRRITVGQLRALVRYVGYGALAVAREGGGPQALVKRARAGDVF